MQRFILKRPVTINGRDFIGRKASVTLMPTESPGWYWHLEDRDILITSHILERRHRRVVLSWGNDRLHVFEHLGVMRFTGLDNVSIHSKTPWLPYDGSAKLFFDACKDAMEPAGTLRPYTIARTIMGGGRPLAQPFVLYKQGSTQKLIVTAEIDYPEFGKTAVTCTFPETDMERLCSFKTQGWPPKLKFFADVASKLGWPHGDSMVWPSTDSGALLALNSFVSHRVLDLLGTFCVLCPPGGMLVGDIRSYHAGHAQDIETATHATSLIVPVAQAPALAAE